MRIKQDSKFMGIAAVGIVIAGGFGIATGCGTDSTASAGPGGAANTTAAPELPQGSEPANLDPPISRPRSTTRTSR